MANAYRKHIWLLETLKRFKRLSYEDINEKWLNSSLNDLGESLSKRTLNNHINAILITYGIEIVCEKGGLYRYYIVDSDDRVIKAQQDAFITTSMIQSCMGDGNIKGRVLMPNLFNSDKLSICTQAMNEGKKLQIREYIDMSEVRRDDGTTPQNKDEIWTIEPYFTYYALYDWYVVGYCRPLEKIVAIKFCYIIDISIREELSFDFPKDFICSKWITDLQSQEKPPMNRPDNLTVLWSDLQVMVASPKGKFF